jgi:hypothetical protein
VCPPVDDGVGDPRGDDLAAQRVLADLLRVAAPQHLREVPGQLAAEHRVLRHVGTQELVEQRDLAVGEDDRELRHRQPPADTRPLLELDTAGEVLELPVEAPERSSASRCRVCTSPMVAECEAAMESARV